MGELVFPHRTYCMLKITFMKMRKVIYLLTSAVVFAFAACNNSISFTLSPNVLQLKPGDIQTIEVIGSSQNLEWTSSNTEVATVYYGVVEAKAIGKTIITAKAGTSMATCEVFVTGTDGATLRITPAVVTLKKGEH